MGLFSKLFSGGKKQEELSDEETVIYSSMDEKMEQAMLNAQKTLNISGENVIGNIEELLEPTR